MVQVAGVTNSTGATSRDVAQAAGDIGLEAEKLRLEVDDFLVTMQDDGERRGYERIAGTGSVAALRMAGRGRLSTEVRDLSCGGRRWSAT
jgi:hypothetical protein